ncbi:polygalacturonase [Sphingomonas jinjuensis]|uniref:Polygalacturonase n=1 Tax=Sphingomonas jinjuensis TaxID=535907 RepID=A0A840F5L7_9SPHN|nr:glycoside hydrolase family 28 protein [Sphingomonas jinjuensis]MBB4153079.1 polygalacturonase [Sphingomonas jinjuensis]
MSAVLLDRRGVLSGAVALAALGIGHPLAAALAQGRSIVDVRGFGAKGDGRALDSVAINRAIDHAAARGGGTVWIPAGTYRSYSIRLRSHITLHLDAGAVLLAADTPIEGMASGGYDHAPDLPSDYAAYQDHGHGHWRNALIWGEGLQDIAIEGPGLIWGKGLGRGHDYDVGRPISGRPGVGDKAIALKLCRNVTLRDFRVLEGGWFALLATGCDNMTIDNLLIDTNRDGLDIDCCRNVHISRCTVNAPWDDAICPKSSFALGYPRWTENLTISDCTVSGSYAIGSVLDGSFRPFPPAPKSTHGRIKLGTESNGGFRNIAISNCNFDTCRGIALETVDGARLEDVAISNVTMRDVTTAPLFLRLGRRLRGPAGIVPGTLKRVSIDNIVVSGAAPMPSIIAGIAGHPVEDIRIANVLVEQVGGASAAAAAIDPPANEAGYPEPDMFGPLPATGFFIRHARNIAVSHVEIQTRAPDARPAFWMQDVAGFDADALRLPAGRSFHLDRVTGFRSRAVGGRPDRTIAGPITTDW